MRASTSGAERKVEQLGSVLIGGRRCVSAEGRAAAWLRGGKANSWGTRWEWKRRADKHFAIPSGTLAECEAGEDNGRIIRRRRRK